MKRSLYIVILIAVLSIVCHADGRFMAEISGQFISPSDQDYKDIYGKSVFYPDLRVGIKIIKDLYAWGSYGRFTRGGMTPVLAIETESSQNFFSFGLGYLFSLTDKLKLDTFAGLSSIHYEEKAMGMEVNGSKIGLRIDGGLKFIVWKSMYTKSTLGYCGAKDAVDDVEIKLGGIQAGIGVGLQF